MKNLLILLLTLAVIVTAFKTFSDTHNRQEFVSIFQQKINEIDRQIDKVNSLQNADINNAPIEDREKVKSEKNGTGKIIIMKDNIDNENNDLIVKGNTDDGHDDLRENQVRKKAPEQTAEDVLNSVKRKTKRKDNFITTEDLNSILSILKSAKNYLKNTSFHLDNNQTNEPTEKSKHTVIKKKLSDGPIKSG